MKKYIPGFTAMITMLVFSCGGSGGSSAPAIASPSASSSPVNAVTITDKGSYFLVEIDYTKAKSRYEIGQEYADDIVAAVPDMQALVDSYLYDMVYSMAGGNAAQMSLFWSYAISRVSEIKPQIPAEYRDELDGMASRLCSSAASTLSDGKLSRDELYLMNLIPDVARGTACSAVAVFGSFSETGSPVVGRNLDWFAGTTYQLAKIQSVAVYKNGSASVCTIGYLGYNAVLTGYNEDGVYAAILDSSTGAIPYSSTGKNSYPFDLRRALEQCANLDNVAAYMKESSRLYAFNHLIMLADKTRSAVLENNFSGSGASMQRAVREYSSALNGSISWGFTNAVGAVNSFLLSGNHDNHTATSANYNRWSSLTTELAAKGSSVSVAELKDVIAYSGTSPLYIAGGNSGNQQCIVFQPATLSLEVSFRSSSGVVSVPPVFLPIPVVF